jgi:hypothetical protein
MFAPGDRQVSGFSSSRWSIWLNVLLQEALLLHSVGAACLQPCVLNTHAHSGEAELSDVLHCIPWTGALLSDGRTGLRWIFARNTWHQGPFRGQCQVNTVQGAYSASRRAMLPHSGGRVPVMLLALKDLHAAGGHR